MEVSETMTAAQLQTVLRWIVVTVAVLMPIVFWRGISEAFDLTKVTVLWVIAPFLIGALILYLVVAGWRTVPVMVGLVSGLLFIALLLASVTSMSVVTSLIGQYSRYTGLVAMTGCLGLFLAASVSFDEWRASKFASLWVAASVPVLVYGFLQVTGNDPFQWGSGAFNVFRMSTMGNPNLAAAFIAIVLPLTAYVMLREKSPVWVAALTGAAFGASVGSLSAFASFQGPVAALATVVFLIATAIWRRVRLGSWLAVGGLVAEVIVAPAIDASGWMLVACAAYAAGMVVAHRKLSHVSAPESLRKNRRAIAAGCGAVLAVAAVVGSGRAWGYVREGWSSGFLERGDFYRSALRIFRAEPVFGSGLETYGLRFPEVRPASHAISLEWSRSSSAHSVPLGMFSNGGVVLGVSYLVFVGVTAWALIRCLRATPPRDRSLVMAFGSAWLAFQIQSLVSIENATLFAMHFIVAGVIMALARERGVLRVGSVKVAKAPKRRARRIPLGAVVGVGLAALLVSTLVMIRPIRAGMASQNATLAVAERGDGDTAVRELNHAIDLAPWEALYRLQLTELYVAAGITEPVAELAAATGERALGSPVLLAGAADAAAKAGDFALALELMDEAAAHDPFAPEIHRRAAERYVEAGASAAAAGDTALARSRYERALELVPDFEPARQALASL